MLFQCVNRVPISVYCAEVVRVNSDTSIVEVTSNWAGEKRFPVRTESIDSLIDWFVHIVDNKENRFPVYPGARRSDQHYGYRTSSGGNYSNVVARVEFGLARRVDECRFD